jgi:hypothetical protein
MELKIAAAAIPKDAKTKKKLSNSIFFLLLLIGALLFSMFLALKNGCNMHVPY